MRMDVSICICTWNRAKSLALTLASLAEVEVPAGLKWEVVVCDNNSTDDTTEVIQAFERRLPLRSIVEKRQGLSHARNAGVREAKGDLVVFTDDDVRFCRDWLAGYDRASREHPTAGFFGGPIIPLYVSPRPGWFTEDVEALCAGMVGRLDGGSEDRLIETVGDAPWGANMGFRREILGQDPFDPSLGLNGKQTMLGEEADLFKRLLDQGHRGWFLSRNSIQHEVPPSRLTTGYIFRRSCYSGRTRVRMAGDYGRWRGYRTGWRGIVDYIAGRLRGNPARWVKGLCQLGVCMGSFWESTFGGGRRRKSGAGRCII